MKELKQKTFLTICGILTVILIVLTQLVTRILRRLEVET